jgi:hypothetical protein
MGRLATRPSRIFTKITSTNSTGYTRSSGRLCQSAISASTVSVIRVIVSFETLAPYTSAKCAEISPWVSPLADSDNTSGSIPSRRRWPVRTITGSKLASRSRGTSISIGPTSVMTVLARFPLRELPRSRPSSAYRS